MNYLLIFYDGNNGDIVTYQSTSLKSLFLEFFDNEGTDLIDIITDNPDNYSLADLLSDYDLCQFIIYKVINNKIEPISIYPVLNTYNVADLWGTIYQYDLNSSKHDVNFTEIIEEVTNSFNLSSLV